MTYLILKKTLDNVGSIFADIPGRVGKGGREFRFLKVRSMIPNALKGLKTNNYKIGPKNRAIKFNIPADVVAKAISVNPGRTRPWQVGGRSLISFDKRIAIDADYASKKSILYDILLILKTPYVVLTMKGAY
jgi:lipopolysaccharide/colanic/teichoic acid biosynthesis glycosyltransferase